MIYLDILTWLLNILIIYVAINLHNIHDYLSVICSKIDEKLFN